MGFREQSPLDIKLQIESICLARPKEESCGLVILDNDKQAKVLDCVNTHSVKEKYFRIDPDEYLHFKINSKMLAIFHSHVHQSENPSDYDRDIFEELCIPYYIYSVKTGKMSLSIPDSYEPDSLLGRVYVEDIYQCSSLVRDYLDEQGINSRKWIENWIVPSDYKEANKLMIKAIKGNCTEVIQRDIAEGDILIFEINDRKIHHMGIYAGNNEFIHQPIDCLSSKAFMDERWAKKVYKIYRAKV